jgi:DeoR family transcriptional regulator, suf operon transcriptional repressor
MSGKMLADNQAKNTRDRVLQTLLLHGRCTINDLADTVEINPISVRHHISRLEADGLVASEETRHGVGRPRRFYFLTEKGREHFPTRYIRLTMRLLEQLKESVPPIFIKGLFTQMAQEMASSFQSEMTGLPMDQRIELVKQFLTQEGFNVEVEKLGDSYHIHESSCPYFQVGQTHPEVCSLDQTIISTLLNIPAQKVQCLLHGDSHCTYIVASDMNPDTILPHLEEQTP